MEWSPSLKDVGFGMTSKVKKKKRKTNIPPIKMKYIKIRIKMTKSNKQKFSNRIISKKQGPNVMKVNVFISY